MARETKMTVRLPPEVKAILKEKAGRYGVSMNAMIVEMICAYQGVPRKKHEKKKPPDMPWYLK